jgi:hypothetical protein
MPLTLVADPRLATTALGITLNSATNLQSDLRRQMLPAHTSIDRSCLSISAIVAADRLHRTSTNNPWRPNPHSARGTPTRSPIAVSSPGGFRTPAASARRTIRRGRHPKPFTKRETLTVSKYFPVRPR